MSTVILAARFFEREGIKAALAGEPEWRVVAETDDAPEAFASVRNLRPDLFLLNLHLPNVRGLQSVREIHRRSPETRLIAMGEVFWEDWLARLFRAGATGFVHGKIRSEELRRALEAALKGLPYHQPPVAEVAGPASEAPPEPTRVRPPLLLDPLTPREKEILRLVCQGRTVQSLARELSISYSTAQSHLRNIMLKTGIKKRVALVRYAIRERLVEEG